MRFIENVEGTPEKLSTGRKGHLRNNISSNVNVLSAHRRAEGLCLQSVKKDLSSSKRKLSERRLSERKRREPFLSSVSFCKKSVTH